MIHVLPRKKAPDLAGAFDSNLVGASGIEPPTTTMSR